jgi:hypothetical protein
MDMLPNEAWLQIMKGLSKQREEFKTSSNRLNEISKSYFAHFEFDKLVFSSIPGILGFEPIEEPIEVDYVEFASVFPMYFSKMRFDTSNNEIMKNSKFIFPVLKKYVVDAVNDSGSMLEVAEKPKADDENGKKTNNKKGFMADL